MNGMAGMEDMGGNQGTEHLVIEAQIHALKESIESRFQSMEALLTQRIRHGDENMEVIMKMLMDTVKEIQQHQHEHEQWATKQVDVYERRFRAIEDRQLTWQSSARTIGLLIGGASGVGGIAGTIVGLTVGG